MPDSPPDRSIPALMDKSSATPLPKGWLSQWPWVTFLAPMIVYMLVGSFEPTPPEGADASIAPPPATEAPAEGFDALPMASSGWLPEIPYRYYPLIYTAKILLVIVTMLLVLPGYRTFAWRVNPWSFVVGIVGVVLWIVLCRAQLEQKTLALVGLDGWLDTGERSAFNPLKFLADTPAWAYGFLAIRFVGLALIVPIMEEFFLRGFLMRYLITQQWWKIPIGEVTRAAILVGTAFPMLTHPPSELLAVLVWFSLVTWWMLRTRNIWDCVIVHMVTNLLLGIYVVASGHWELM